MVRFSYEGKNGENNANDEDVCDSLSLTIKMSYGCDKQLHRDLCEKQLIEMLTTLIKVMMMTLMAVAFPWKMMLTI